MTPVEVRAQLTDALRLDLGGPGAVLGVEGHAAPWVFTRATRLNVPTDNPPASVHVRERP
jgi:hypothetical protein